jgi:type IX secretion system PorP/SprF family membrane protein
VRIKAEKKKTDSYFMRLQGISKRLFGILLSLGLTVMLSAQSTPSNPLSIPVYHPMVLNPAYAGSKDFTNVTLTTKVLKSLEHQVINVHQRLTSPNGFFSNFGVGAYLFQEQLDQSWNTGLALTGSYHIPLDESHVHNLSVGASLKGFLNVAKSSEALPGDTLTNNFNPNMDLGLYYYGPTAFAGLSVTTLFGTRTDENLTVDSEAYIPREYHLYGGYKFLVNRKNSIVIEPSLLLSLSDSTFSEPQKHLIPYLKVYLQNFYLGTYMKSIDLFALFFQYQFPRFHTGVFLEFPRVGFLNNDNIIFELSLGINLSRGGQKFLQHRHW